jgi:hypothetical protein
MDAILCINLEHRKDRKEHILNKYINFVRMV